MKIRINIIILFLGLAVSIPGLSQERLSSVGAYPELSNAPKVFKSGMASLELPFVDDFSSSFPYPDRKKWIDANAYTNMNLGDNSPGIGIATLDAIDSTGAIYSNANISGFFADKLTSMPINLNIGGDTSVYLSFFYQAQGLGDAPEDTDSLILEFYSPQDSKWHWIWSTPGSGIHEFKQILIPVRGALFLRDSFQFRFSNIASLADAYEPSFQANADHWHLDYIYLNKNRHYQDSVMNDLVIQKNIGSLLLNFTSIPWQHFQQAGINEVSTIFPINIKNLSGERRYYEPIFSIEDVYGIGQGFNKTLVADEIQSFQELNYDATFNYGFTSDATDSAKFLIQLDLNSTELDLIPENTVVSYEQIFNDYYSYDDGSAEAGYGITGDGSNTASIAVKYHNFNPGDSLKGVSIFFNKSFENSNRKYFQLALWADEGGTPGALIYLQDGYRAGFENGLMGFDYFDFDTSQVVAESFFIGIKQVTPDFLNIGFDKNTDHQEEIFYRIAADWRNTSFEGSLMLRPVFANKSKKTGIQRHELLTNQEDLRVYPNPVVDEINIEFSYDLSSSPYQIISQTGQVVLHDAKLPERLSIKTLPAGTYYLIVSAGQTRISKKFIKL